MSFGTNSISVGRWDYLTLTYSTGDAGEVFLNGVSVTTDAAVGAAFDAGTEIHIGRRGGDLAVPYDGKLAYVQANGFQLSTTEIVESMWKPGMIPKESDVFIALWSAGSNTSPDLSGNGRNGTNSATGTSTTGPDVFFGGGLPL